MNTAPNAAGGGVSSGVDAEAIEVLIRSLVGPDCPSIEYEGPERRVHRRYVKPLPVAATPVDENNYAIGARFDTIARDISAGGVCLLHNEPIDANATGARYRLAAGLAGAAVVGSAALPARRRRLLRDCRPVHQLVSETLGNRQPCGNRLPLITAHRDSQGLSTVGGWA